jgi:glycosyltransferase involved in cell wall biosynthesis
MAAGRPVICLDLGGPALQVTEETGIKIPAISPSQAIADLSSAMEELARDPARRARLGQSGRERVSRLYNWEEKGKYLADLYDQAVSAKLPGDLRPLRAAEELIPLRILISAYACEPEKGSEPGVGWNWAQQMGRYHEVWVITRANNRAPIEKALAKEPLPNVHWVHFDLPRWARFWKDRHRGIHLYYYLWQIGAYFVARKLHRRVSFNLVHHVTFVNYWMPSFMALLPVPFVWGPVGGGESAPRSFWSSFSLRGKAYELLRDLARFLAEFDPFVRFAARRATVGLATTSQTEKRLRALGCRKVLIHPAVGLVPEEIRTLNAMPLRQSDPFRFFSIGELLHLKGFDLGLRAFARFQARFPATEYWIIGDGPERKRLEKLAHSLGLAGKVRFWGTIPRTEVLAKLADCDVLVHPSLHDSGGWVCLEAMAAGRPVICLDLGGPALQVTEDTGIKVPATWPERVVSDLAAAFYKLASDPELRARLGLGARKRVEEHFNWEKKGLFMTKLYESLSIVEEGTTAEGELFA